MFVFESASEVRRFSREARKQGKRIALVPTMGYLHAGHLSLVQAAREKASIVIVSIYVNPTQFSTNEDFGVYPTSLDEDHKLLEKLQVSAIFQPKTLYRAGSDSSTNPAARVAGAGELKPGDHETFVQTELLQKPLCGVSRPHFFKGVATIVTKLFNIVEPDVAIFGSKDFQQLQVIKKLVRDLDFDIEIVGMPIMREDDGLAMSSRNALLTKEQRRAAPLIRAALLRGEEDWQAGVPPSTICKHVVKCIEEAGGQVDYVQVVDAETLQDAEGTANKGNLVIAVAVFMGSVRLIDNLQIQRA